MAAAWEGEVLAGYGLRGREDLLQGARALYEAGPLEEGALRRAARVTLVDLHMRAHGLAPLVARREDDAEGAVARALAREEERRAPPGPGVDAGEGRAGAAAAPGVTEAEAAATVGAAQAALARELGLTPEECVAVHGHHTAACGLRLGLTAARKLVRRVTAKRVQQREAKGMDAAEARETVAYNLRIVARGMVKAEARRRAREAASALALPQLSVPAVGVGPPQ